MASRVPLSLGEGTKSSNQSKGMTGSDKTIHRPSSAALPDDFVPLPTQGLLKKKNATMVQSNQPVSSVRKPFIAEHKHAVGHGPIKRGPSLSSAIHAPTPRFPSRAMGSLNYASIEQPSAAAMDTIATSDILDSDKHHTTHQFVTPNSAHIPARFGEENNSPNHEQTTIASDATKVDDLAISAFTQGFKRTRAGESEHTLPSAVSSLKRLKIKQSNIEAMVDVYSIHVSFLLYPHHWLQADFLEPYDLMSSSPRRAPHRRGEKKNLQDQELSYPDDMRNSVYYPVNRSSPTGTYAYQADLDYSNRLAHDGGQSTLDRLLLHDTDLFVTEHMQQYDKQVKKWRDCTFDEWQGGATGKTSAFTLLAIG
jgi:hypothetical protein